MRRSYRIDPAYDAIHIVDTENGGERVKIPYPEVDFLINDLFEVKKSKNVI